MGALTVLELLHAADRCWVAAEPERHLDEGLLMGYFWLAAGWLSGLVGRLGRSDIRPSRAFKGRLSAPSVIQPPTLHYQ